VKVQAGTRRCQRLPEGYVSRWSGATAPSTIKERARRAPQKRARFRTVSSARAVRVPSRHQCRSDTQDRWRA